ncbi:MAG: S-layer homology domain-containing protein, partial [Firmicutes bacterium]|nr:S-layer homology domain-containing protein [Bacillota bacterium]
HWARNYILWGRENNILSGYEDNTFRPDQSISRQEMASVLYRYITNYYHKELVIVSPEIVFADRDKIAFWAADAVRAMQRSGIINGRGNDLFDPLVGATRAETTVMMNRFITYYRSEEITEALTADIYFNQQLVQQNTDIITINDTYMLPIRSLLEPAGFEIRYYPEAELIVAYRHDRDMELWLGDTVFYNNGARSTLSAPPALLNGTTYVPLRETATTATIICQIKEEGSKTNIYLTAGTDLITLLANNFQGQQNNATGTAFIGNNKIGYWGTLKNGRPSYGAYLLPDGELYFGNWQNGNLNGTGRSVNQYGEFFIGTFSNNVKQTGTLYYTNGSKFIGTFTKNSSNVVLPSVGQYIAADGTIYGNSDSQWSSGSLPQSKW